jgi:hypothetical protein
MVLELTPLEQNHIIKGNSKKGSKKLKLLKIKNILIFKYLINRPHGNGVYIQF